jgi:hypothetical protein
MKTRLATILAVVMFVAVGVLNVSQTNAKNAKDFSPAPALNSKANMTPAVMPPATNWNFEKNHGKIARIYPEPAGVYFRFGGLPSEVQTAMSPTNGYYFIPMSHPNYKALVDLLYLAAEHGWNLNARTQTTLSASGSAEVIYLVQDLP